MILYFDENTREHLGEKDTYYAMLQCSSFDHVFKSCLFVMLIILCRKYKKLILYLMHALLKVFIMLYHFVIMIAMFSYAANVESYAHNSPCKAYLVSTTL